MDKIETVCWLTVILLIGMIIGATLAYYDVAFGVVKTLIPITPTGEYLTPDSNKSAVYNMGFAQGYLAP